MSYYAIIFDYNIRLSGILISCCSILGKLTFENTENIYHVLNSDGISQILNITNKCHNNDSLIILCLNLLCALCLINNL